MLALLVLCCICLTVLLLIMIDKESSVKVPILHHTGSIASWFTKMVFKTDSVETTIRDTKKLGKLSISNICRLTDE